MKIIDMLNLKYNKELEDGFKFIHDDLVYTYHEKLNCFKSRSGNNIGGNTDIELVLDHNVIVVTPELIKEINED